MRLPFGVGYVVLGRVSRRNRDRTAAAILEALRWPLRVLARRRDVAALARLGDRDLADIGLTRSDVIEAADEAVFGSPYEVLAQRARERAMLSLPPRR
jgi:uncharacterized protein YjiS (DUF1127 family)